MSTENPDDPRTVHSPAALLAHLEAGASVWNAVVRGGTMRDADLTATSATGRPYDLSGLTFESVDLTGANFDGVTAHDIHFIDCTLDDSTHIGADYSARQRGSAVLGGTAVGAQFMNVNLTRGRIQRVADMTGFNATGAMLIEASVDHNFAPRSTWDGALLTGNAHLCENELTEATLAGLRIPNGCLTGNILAGADGTNLFAPGADFSSVRARGFSARGATFDGAQMIEMEWVDGTVDATTSLCNANVQDSLMSGTPFQLARTDRMKWGKTMLTAADFTPQRWSARMDPTVWYLTRSLPLPEELRPVLKEGATGSRVGPAERAGRTVRPPVAAAANRTPLQRVAADTFRIAGSGEFHAPLPVLAAGTVPPRNRRLPLPEAAAASTVGGTGEKRRATPAKESRTPAGVPRPPAARSDAQKARAAAVTRERQA